MPLVTSEKMLSDAQKGGYAVGEFQCGEYGDGKSSNQQPRRRIHRLCCRQPHQLSNMEFWRHSQEL